MSFYQIKEVREAQEKKQDKPIRPTLMIGLGGTGKEVLLRFRRLIVEQYGSLSELPFLAFLHMDTDQTQSAAEQLDLKSGDDPLYEKIAFQPSEKIQLKIQGGADRYIKNSRNYPHIKTWFQTQGKIAGLGDLGDGAGTVRMASRLGFFHNFDTIAEELSNAHSKLKLPNIDQAAAQHGFKYDANGSEVFIISSLGGGTGAGTFLDLGFLVKDLIPDAERVAMLFMPGIFKGYAAANRIAANGYAALKELNHYAFGHHWKVDWNNTGAKVQLPPPFNYTYLIDATNEAGRVIGSSGKECALYQMVAETIFQDYWIGSYAASKRATRINLVQYMNNVYAHDYWQTGVQSHGSDGMIKVKGDTYPTRFGSLGLSMIRFPIERIHNACGARLAIQILNYWRNQVAAEPLDPLVSKFLTHSEVNFLQGRHTRKDGGAVLDRKDVNKALLWYDASQGKSFQDLLWTQTSNLRMQLEQLPKGQKSAALKRFMDEFQQNMGLEDSDKDKDWGPYTRTIHENMLHALDRLQKGMEKVAAELAADSDFGVAQTVAILGQLKVLLQKGSSNDVFFYKPYFDASYEHWSTQSQAFGARVEELRAALFKAENIRFFWKQDAEIALEKLLGDPQKKGVLYQYMLARVMRQVCKCGVQICRTVDQVLGLDDINGAGLIAKYYQLLGGLTRLSNRLQQKEIYFSREPTYDFCISLYKDDDMDDLFETWAGQDKGLKITWDSVGQQILNNVFHAESVAGALQQIQTRPTGDLEGQIHRICKDFFKNHSHQPSALRLLFDNSRYDASQRREMIQRVYTLGKVWLKEGQGGIGHTNYTSPRSFQKPVFIGADDSDLNLLEDFKATMREIRNPSDPEPSYQSIGRKHNFAIVFYTELAGVPAFYPDSVTARGGLQEEYNKIFSSSDAENQEELHTHKNRFKFGSFVPKTDSEVLRFKEALRAVVLGNLLGLFEVTRSDEDPYHPEFSYSFTHNDDIMNRNWNLGTEARAIDHLYRDIRDQESQRHIIMTKIDDVISELQRQNKLHIYLLFLDFALTQIYPPQPNREDIGMSFEQFSPQAATIEAERERLFKEIVFDPRVKQQVMNALTSLRGKPLSATLTYEEFDHALTPFAKKAGQFPVRTTTTVGGERNKYLDIFVLDHNILTEQDQEPRRKTTKTPPPPIPNPHSPANAARPCPNCLQEINVRAIHCRHCKQAIATHVTCPSCHQDKVTNDATSCWECGQEMPSREEHIECQGCFSFEGSANQFPCPVCGYDPNQAEGPGGQDQAAQQDDQQPEEEVSSGPGEQKASSYEAPDTSDSQDDQELKEEPETDHSDTQDPGPQSDTETKVEKVECPGCFTMVSPGPHCDECGTPLGSEF